MRSADCACCVIHTWVATAGSTRCQLSRLCTNLNPAEASAEAINARPESEFDLLVVSFVGTQCSTKLSESAPLHCATFLRLSS